MNKRTIKVYYTQSGKSDKILAAARTKKELLKEIPTLEDKKLIIRETKETLELSDAVLPSKSFTLFVFPKKSKAGVNGPLPMTGHEIRGMRLDILRKRVRRMVNRGTLPKKALKMTEKELRAFVIERIAVINKPVKKTSKKSPVTKKKISRKSSVAKKKTSKKDSIADEASRIEAELDL